MSRRVLSALLILTAWSTALAGQSTPPSSGNAAVFEVAVIKPNRSGTLGGGVRSSPSGQITATGAPLSYLLSRALLEPGTARVDGMPPWAFSDRYDFIVKAPAGTSGTEQQRMWRQLAVDRLKLATHFETREESTYDLVVARADGRLGPQLKPSTLDCAYSPQSRSSSG